MFCNIQSPDISDAYTKSIEDLSKTKTMPLFIFPVIRGDKVQYFLLTFLLISLQSSIGRSCNSDSSWMMIKCSVAEVLRILLFI